MTSSFAEWQENEIRLLAIVKKRRNARLAPLLQGTQPPTPCDGNLEPQRSPISTVLQLGPFPSEIFLKASAGFLTSRTSLVYSPVVFEPQICSMTNPRTLYILEQVSRSAKDIIRSPLAEGVWRQARLSLGLESKFPGWNERAFVHYAINRRCAVRTVSIPARLCACFWDGVLYERFHSSARPKG